MTPFSNFLWTFHAWKRYWTEHSRSLSRHGAQNAYDEASKATLENEFGTSKEDDCMIQILEKGDLQHTSVSLTISKQISSSALTYELHNRLENVKDQRMIPWEAVRLIEVQNLHIQAKRLGRTGWSAWTFALVDHL